MKLSVLFMLFITFLFGGIQNTIYCQTQSSGDDSTDAKKVLDVFVGKWEGHGTAFFPRVKNRPNREENVTVVGTKVLDGNYIQCDAKWTRTDGQSRELFIFFNFDVNINRYKVLFLYDDWGQIVNYPLTYYPKERVFRGVDKFITSDSVAAEEHVEWWISKDGNEITGREFNHFATDPKDFWPRSFEFVWKRK